MAHRNSRYLVGHAHPTRTETHGIRFMHAHIQITTTTPNREMADAIAAALVAERLAACVQVSGPITSTYRWKGAVETSQEWLCAAKTRGDRYADVERVIRRQHSYEEPEIIALPIVAGSAGYLRWIDEEVRPVGPS
jgi:periplasmic divalent cation tolerance protein